VPHIRWFYPGICLTTEDKARKNVSKGSRSHAVAVVVMLYTGNEGGFQTSAAEVSENRALLGCHVARNGSFLPTFRENLSVPLLAA
jgi:hypothetical protein